jgi:hypothetical protein
VRHTGENENKKIEKDTDVVQTVYETKKARKSDREGQIR